MSLEQALVDATAAIARLTVVLTTAAEAGAVSAPAPKAAKPPPQEVVAAPQEVASKDATRYFDIPKYRTVAAIQPGEPVPSVESATEVTEVEYQVKKDFYAATVKTPAAAAPAPASTPEVASSESSATAAPAAASEVKFDAVLEKLKALHKIKQNPGVKAILDKYGVSRAPELAGKALNADIIAAIELEMACA